MTRGRDIAGLLLSLALAACSGEPDPSAQTSRAQPAATDADSHQGAPRIANSADGVHIQYRVYGAGEPAVVLVHGWSCDSNYWNAQLDALKSKYTVVSVDLAGHGASGKNRTDWSMGNYGEDVAAVVRQIANPRVVLVGHSMGAPVALEATRRIGDRVIGVIAVDALKSVGLPPVSEQEVAMRIAPFEKDFIGHTRKFVTDYFFHESADPALIRKIADDMSLAPPEVAIASMKALQQLDFASLTPDIHVPVVAINADRGEPTDEARIRKSLPDFRAVVLENTGHFLMMEAPERFNPVLLEEIAAVAGGAAASS